MSDVRFIMVGGFLGAGKTTTLARLARTYTEAGHTVGVVTNDQADDLVDTHNLRSQGLDVREVPGACFCCKFDDLVANVQALAEGRRPDIILAEPVGSCTDLVATVVQPFKDLYADDFRVAPYAVLFKPSHGLRILRGEAAGGFSPKAAYIFRKQLEEADAIVINRVDEVTAEGLTEIKGLLAQEYPGTPVLATSAKTGDGFDALVALLAQDGAFGQKILDIDYDTYAEGEAELGWLNLTCRVEADAPFPLDGVLTDALSRIAGEIASEHEVAHLKLIGMADGGFGVANLVNTGGEGVLSAASHQEPLAATVIVNARVAMDPATLDGAVRRAASACGTSMGLRVTFEAGQHLRPGRPTPTHRYAAAKA